MWSEVHSKKSVKSIEVTRHDDASLLAQYDREKAHSA